MLRGGRDAGPRQAARVRRRQVGDRARVLSEGAHPDDGIIPVDVDVDDGRQVPVDAHSLQLGTRDERHGLDAVEAGAAAGHGGRHRHRAGQRGEPVLEPRHDTALLVQGDEGIDPATVAHEGSDLAEMVVQGVGRRPVPREQYDVAEGPTPDETAQDIHAGSTRGISDE